MSGIRKGIERINESAPLTTLWVTRPGLALAVAMVMGAPPALRAVLEALGLR
jgi:hypothetical protein